MSAPDTRGARLRRLRKFRGWTQAEVGQMVGRTVTHISLCERNRRAPSRNLLFVLADLYDVTATFIETGRN